MASKVMRVLSAVQPAGGTNAGFEAMELSGGVLWRTTYYRGVSVSVAALSMLLRLRKSMVLVMSV